MERAFIARAVCGTERGLYGGGEDPAERLLRGLCSGLHCPPGTMRPPSLFLVVGMHGTGRTHALQRAVAAARAIGDIAVVSVSKTDSHVALNASEFGGSDGLIREISEQLQKTGLLPQNEASAIAMDFEAKAAAATKADPAKVATGWVLHAARKKPLLIAIDGFERFCRSHEHFAKKVGIASVLMEMVSDPTSRCVCVASTTDFCIGDTLAERVVSRGVKTLFFPVLSRAECQAYFRSLVTLPESFADEVARGEWNKSIDALFTDPQYVEWANASPIFSYGAPAIGNFIVCFLFQFAIESFVIALTRAANIKISALGRLSKREFITLNTLKQTADESVSFRGPAFLVAASDLSQNDIIALVAVALQSQDQSRSVTMESIIERLRSVEIDVTINRGLLSSSGCGFSLARLCELGILSTDSPTIRNVAEGFAAVRLAVRFSDVMDIVDAFNGTTLGTTFTRTFSKQLHY